MDARLRLPTFLIRAPAPLPSPDGLPTNCPIYCRIRRVGRRGSPGAHPFIGTVRAREPPTQLEREISLRSGFAESGS